jgi:hypothetical protein
MRTAGAIDIFEKHPNQEECILMLVPQHRPKTLNKAQLRELAKTFPRSFSCNPIALRRSASTGGPGNQAAADLLAVFLNQVTKFQPPTRQ